MAGDGIERWIERVAPLTPMDLSEFTGERYLTGLGGEIEAEHVHRYLFAAGLCVGKDVLDIACGEGYGAAMLAQVATSVAGVDIDEATIGRAREAYRGDRIEFRPGSCEDIPYKRSSFDVVVSFETIEHIANQDRFLREVRRVLRSGGVLICSTPDADVYRHPDGANPYHVNEMTRLGFEQLLGSRFTNVCVLGQRLVSGSVIARGGQAKTDLVTTRDGNSFEKRRADAGAVYLIAVCSERRLPTVDDSVLSDTRYSIGWVTSLETRQGELGSELATARAREAEAGARARQTAEHAERAEQALLDLKIERDAAIREAAVAQADLERTAAEVEPARAAITEASRKAAIALANEAAARAACETLQAAREHAVARKDEADDALKHAAIEAALAEERAKRAGDTLKAVQDDADRRIGEALEQARRAHAVAAEATADAGFVRGSRSWRWMKPLRMATAAIRSARVRGMSFLSRVLDELSIPWMERRRATRRIRRRAAKFRASRLFDAAYYLEHNPDVCAAGVDPAIHFAISGGFEGRRPSAQFDTAAYLAANPDVAQAGVHPFEHYLATGVYEGRSPLPDVPETVPEAAAEAAPVIEVNQADVPHVEVDPTLLTRTKVLAFYLPQFHPIPENDEWWGQGFTEWTNVSRGRAMFPGHTQPMLPGGLGFYDLRLEEVRERQAELARAAGIHGFCYYHYWFNGRRVLERPLDDVLRSGRPDFPFCVCWANENWTRLWDGMENEILLTQHHSLASDRRFILDLLPYLEDERHVRVDGRPVVLVYRPDLMICAADTAAVWRDECSRAGIGEVHLCAVQFRTGDPRPLGFDAAVEFPPHHFPSPEITGRVEGLDPSFGGEVFDYRAGVVEMITRSRKVDYRLYRGVMPSWDNTARRMEQARIYFGSTPQLYESWLRAAINQPQPNDGIGENLVFVNAWNEWAEGTVLEPTRNGGDAYLRATARALGREALDKHLPKLAEPIEVAAPPAGDGGTNGSVTVATHEGGSAIELKLKRVVRRNAALNAFVDRHPALKDRAVRLVRRVAGRGDGASRPAASGGASGGVRWRGPSSNAGAARLLVVSHDAALAGAQMVLLENIRHWVRDGIDCRVLLLGSGVLESEFSGLCPAVCVDDIEGKSGKDACEVVLADLATRGWMPDAAFCNTVVSVEAMSVCARRRIGVVSAVYELPTSIDGTLGGSKTMKRIMRCSSRVMVSSAFVRDRLSAAYGIDADRLEPVHTGVLSRRLPDRQETRAAIRRELGVSDDAIVVLGCGSIHHRKGTDLFVAAAAEARKHAGDRQIVFAWVGEDESGPTFGNWCRHDAERMGVKGMVRFITHDRSPRWFAGSDLFALTSREDGFPMVNLEALAAGLAVVGFDGSGGAIEVLQGDDGDARGIVVPYMDTAAMGAAIARLALDDEELQALRARASAFADEHLSWDRYMKEIHRMLTTCSDRFAASVSAR